MRPCASRLLGRYWGPEKSTTRGRRRSTRGPESGALPDPGPARSTSQVPPPRARGAAQGCSLPAGPSLHPPETFPARPALAPARPPAGRGRCPAPLSSDFLARWGAARGPTSLVPRSGLQGGCRGREQPAAAAPSESDFQTCDRLAAPPGQPRALCASGAAERLPRGECPSAVLARRRGAGGEGGSARSAPGPCPPGVPVSAPCGVRTCDSRGGSGLLVPLRATVPAGLRARRDVFCWFYSQPRKKKRDHFGGPARLGLRPGSSRGCAQPFPLRAGSRIWSGPRPFWERPSLGSREPGAARSLFRVGAIRCSRSEIPVPRAGRIRVGTRTRAEPLAARTRCGCPLLNSVYLQPSPLAGKPGDRVQAGKFLNIV